MVKESSEIWGKEQRSEASFGSMFGRYRLLFGVLVYSAVTVALGQSAAAQSASGHPAAKRWEAPPDYAYVHVGVGGNFYTVKGDDLEAIMSPFELSPVHYGGCLYVAGGLRNIAQVEYRWGRDVSKFFFDEFSLWQGMERNEIPVKFAYSQWLLKLNPLAGARGLREYAIFFIFGKGDVELVDDRGDGFLDGKKTTYGVELARIARIGEVSVSLEHHQMDFERFAIRGVGELEQEFEASSWQLNLKLAFGLGE